MPILNMLYGSGSGGYAIYDLSLTNDDTNEQVIVKWFEYMPANWLKTVVRYKTGSAPTSITDGTLAVEETTKNQYSSTGYGVSGLSDDTTYYFSVFAIDSNGTIINVQSKDIKTEFTAWEVNENTMLYMPLESDATERSGNNISTTPTNITYTTLGGVKCATANGSSSKISIGTVSSLSNSLTEGTISIIIYGQQWKYGSANAKFLEHAKATGFFGSQNDGSTYIRLFTSAFQRSHTGTDNLNERIFLTMTFDSSGAKVFKNGVQVSTGTLISGEPVWGRWTNSYEIGYYLFCSRGGGNNYWKGGAREYILEKRKRSDDEVVRYYNRIKKKIGIA